MLLFRYLRLSHCLLIRTNNTEPTLYVYIIMYLYANARVQKYTHNGRLCRYVLDDVNLRDSK